MMTVSHDVHLWDVQRAAAIMIFAVGVLGAVAVLSVPFSIGLCGLRGLWIPAVLLIPLALQAWALRVLRRAESALPG
ncbi:hypothetical protein HMPREF2883_06795 [Actinomyces sp. HMSC075C01]|uniref:Uncharacterized protein n=1 Tax=Actinomyces oris TaxID=544580 RepID=A0A1Q8VWP5_9ACTO|nr:hypothetical protein HMPREF2883_06795 [Actinomyces sp. HMSC075C01]OLO52687.1 hypothetical protein BKH27_08915 [Actinomyces oris]